MKPENGEEKIPTLKNRGWGGRRGKISNQKSETGKGREENPHPAVFHGDFLRSSRLRGRIRAAQREESAEAGFAQVETTPEQHAQIRREQNMAE